MGYAKIDDRILTSSVWRDRDQTRLLETCIHLARPAVTDEPIPQLDPRTGRETGWAVPQGSYGLVELATSPLLQAAYLLDREAGLDALCALGSPDDESRDPNFEGRRVVRVQGGYILLNYMKFREVDHTGAKRSKEYRDRQREKTDDRDATRDDRDASRDVTHSTANAPATAIPNLTCLPTSMTREAGRGGEAEALTPGRAALRARFLQAGVRDPLAFTGPAGVDDQIAERVAENFEAYVAVVKESKATDPKAALAARCRDNALTHPKIQPLRPSASPQPSGPPPTIIELITTYFSSPFSQNECTPSWLGQIYERADGVVVAPHEVAMDDRERLVNLVELLGLSMEFSSQNVAL